MTAPLAAIPADGGLWTAWEPDPLLAAVLVALAVGHVRGSRALRRPDGRGVGRWQAAAFHGGLVACAAALATPLEALAEVRFSAHMVQHMLLVLVAAPLLALAAPSLPLTLALPRRWRARIARWRHHPAASAAWHTLTQPLVALSLHILVLWGWHLPAVYQAALGSPLLHALEHASFLGTAWLLWRVALGPVRPSTRRPVAGAAGERVAPGLAVLLVFATTVQGNVLGALLTLAPASPLYPEQVTDLADQQLAGLLMWVPGDVVYLAAAVALFRRWLRAMERATPSGTSVTEPPPTPTPPVSSRSRS